MAIKKNYSTLAAGIGVITVGAYILMKKLTPKSNIIVQYEAEADKTAAGIIRDALSAKYFVKGYIDANSFISPLVVVGGPMVNSLCALFSQNFSIPQLTEANTGNCYISLRTWRGIQVVFVYGWLQSDTLLGANYIRQIKGLPTQDMVI